MIVSAARRVWHAISFASGRDSAQLAYRKSSAQQLSTICNKIQTYLSKILREEIADDKAFDKSLAAIKSHVPVDLLEQLQVHVAMA